MVVSTYGTDVIIVVLVGIVVLETLVVNGRRVGDCVVVGGLVVIVIGGCVLLRVVNGMSVLIVSK